MPYFLCDTIGDGSDAEGNQIRPALALYSDTWTAMCYGASRVLVKAAHVAAFDSDVRIRQMRRALLAAFAPDDGETDDWDAADLARKFGRRLLLQQWLGLDDLGDLASTIGDMTAAKRQRIRNRLLAFSPTPIDISSLTLSTTIADALRFILPQIAFRLAPRPMGQSGTFTDNFNGEVGTVDLTAHTPSGGTAWTRVDGSANMAEVRTTNVLVHNTLDANGAAYRCDDQGSADQYVQYVTTANVNVGCFVCNRVTDRANYIGFRSNAATPKTQIFKRVTSTFTQLGSNGATTVVAGDTLRLESSGNDHTAYLNGVAQVGPTTDAAHNTVTRQGVNARSAGTLTWLDNFEAGVLGGGGGFIPYPRPRGFEGGLSSMRGGMQ